MPGSGHMPATWRFDFNSAPTAVREVLDDIGRRSAAMGLTKDVDLHVQIVLAELLNNVVEHAYAETPGCPIRLDMQIADSGINIHVIDEGIALPNEEIPGKTMPSLDTPDLPEGGFGWALIQTIATDISYIRANGENQLQLTIPNP